MPVKFRPLNSGPLLIPTTTKNTILKQTKIPAEAGCLQNGYGCVNTGLLQKHMDLRKVVLKQKPHPKRNHSGNLPIRLLPKNGLKNLKMSQFENLRINRL